VWSWTQFCARALLHGVHPYTVQPPDIYGGAFNFGYRTTIYPYMPLTLIVYAPAVALVGDYRFILALCLPLTVWLLAAAGQRLAVERRLIDALILALVLHPRGAYMIAFGWLEPLLLLSLAAFVYLAARAPDGWGQAVAFLLLPALRQFVVAPVVMYLGSSLYTRRRARAVVIGTLVAAATVAPFVFWNWRATLGGITFNMRAPFAFRDDSDSLTALFASVTGRDPGRWLGPAAQIAVGAPAYLALRRYGLVGLLLASALCLLATFLLGSQAFVNYYYFPEALLLYAALVIAQGPLPCA